MARIRDLVEQISKGGCWDLREFLRDEYPLEHKRSAKELGKLSVLLTAAANNDNPLALLHLLEHGGDLFTTPDRTSNSNISDLPAIIIHRIWTLRIRNFCRARPSKSTWVGLGGDILEGELIPWKSQIPLKRLRIPGNERSEIALVEVGRNHGVLVASKHIVHVWGLDGQIGRLGLADRTKPISPIGQTRVELEPVINPFFKNGFSAVRQVTCGDHHTVVTVKHASSHPEKRSYSVYVWGANDLNQLGIPHTGQASTQHIPYPVGLKVRSKEKKRVVGVCAGANHTLLWTSDGALFAWGDNRKGQTGHDRNQFPLVIEPREIILEPSDFRYQVTLVAARDDMSLIHSAEGIVVAFGEGLPQSRMGFDPPPDQNPRDRLSQWGTSVMSTIYPQRRMEAITLAGKRSRWAAMVDTASRVWIARTNIRPLIGTELPVLHGIKEVTASGDFVYCRHYTGVVFVVGPLPLREFGGAQLLQFCTTLQPPTSGSSKVHIWPLTQLAAVERIVASDRALYALTTDWRPNATRFFTGIGAVLKKRWAMLPGLPSTTCAKVPLDREDEWDPSYEETVEGAQSFGEQTESEKWSELFHQKVPTLKFLTELTIAKQKVHLGNVMDFIELSTTKANAEALHLYCIAYLACNLCRSSVQFSKSEGPLASLTRKRHLQASTGSLLILLTMCMRMLDARLVDFIRLGARIPLCLRVPEAASLGHLAYTFIRKAILESVKARDGIKAFYGTANLENDRSASHKLSVASSLIETDLQDAEIDKPTCETLDIEAVPTHPTPESVGDVSSKSPLQNVECRLKYVEVVEPHAVELPSPDNLDVSTHTVLSEEVWHTIPCRKSGKFTGRERTEKAFPILPKADHGRRRRDINLQPSASSWASAAFPELSHSTPIVLREQGARGSSPSMTRGSARHVPNLSNEPKASVARVQELGSGRRIVPEKSPANATWGAPKAPLTPPKSLLEISREEEELQAAQAAIDLEEEEERLVREAIRQSLLEVDVRSSSGTRR